MTQKIRIARMPWFDELQLAVFDIEHNGKQHVAMPLTMREHTPGTLLGEPTMRFSMREAQELVDELWACGLRPTEGSGSAGSLKATETHLADMRRIAFELLDMKEEGA